MAATCQVFSRGLTHTHTNAVKTPGGLQKMVTGVVQDKIFYTEVKLKQKDLLNSQEYNLRWQLLQSWSWVTDSGEQCFDVSPGSSLWSFVKGETPGLSYLEHHLYVQGFHASLFPGSAQTVFVAEYLWARPRVDSKNCKYRHLSSLVQRMFENFLLMQRSGEQGKPHAQSS